ncbi:Uncharacterized protein DAT39_020436, partial [Clarias magur]
WRLVWTWSCCGFQWLSNFFLQAPPCKAIHGCSPGFIEVESVVSDVAFDLLEPCFLWRRSLDSPQGGPITPEESVW